MAHNSETDKIFIKKKRNRSYKNSSRPLSPKGHSEGVSLTGSYQDLDDMAGEKLPVNISTKLKYSAQTS